jgi:hypothetical protein
MKNNFQRIGLMAFVVAVSLPIGAQEKAETKPSTTAMLEAIRQEARQDFGLTAKKLRAMNPSAMSDDDHQIWLRLARSAALRIGDRDWLLSLSTQNDRFSSVHVYRVLLASSYLSEGNLPAARSELARIEDLRQLNTRDQRRYWSIKARLEQLDGNIADERYAIENIMHELARWPSKDCQSCHDDPKQKEVLPLLDVRNFWFAKRYIELMQIQGDAESVKEAALRKLASAPRDDEARIFLAHALQALGSRAEGEQLLKEIRWVAFPDRTGPSSRMMFAWP